MDPIHVMKVMVDFNKMVFDRTFSVLADVQDQAEQTIVSWLDQNRFLKEHEKKIAYDWVAASRTSRRDFREKIDQGYRSIGDYIAALERERESPT